MTVAGPDVRCATCGNVFRPIRRGGGGVCPQCGDVAEPDAAAPPGRCPQCGEPVPADAAACGACGELLGEFGPAAVAAADWPTDLSLVSVWRAAWADWKDHLGTLLACWAFVGGVTIVIGSSLYGGMIYLVYLGLVAGGGRFHWLPIAFAGLALWVGLCALWSWGATGLCRTHLDAVRAGTAEAPHGPNLGRLFRRDGFGRTLLAGLTLGTFVATAVYGPQFLLFVGIGFGGGPPGILALAAALIVYLLPWVTAAAAFTLFWPIPFVAVDQPGVRGFRPVAACFTLPAGRWGSHVAVGLAAAGLLFAGGLTCAGLLFTGPLAGLVLAHGYRGLIAGEAVADDGGGLSSV